MGPRADSGCPFRTFNGLDDGYCFQRRVRCLFPLSSRFVGRVGVCFYLSAKDGAVRRASVLVPGPLYCLVVYALLIFVRQVRECRVISLGVRAPSFVEMSLGSLLLRRSVRRDKEGAKAFRRFFLERLSREDVAWSSQGLCVFRRRNRLLKHPKRGIGRGVRTSFVKGAYRAGAGLSFKFVNSSGFLLRGGDLFVGREFGGDGGIFGAALLLRLNSTLLQFFERWVGGRLLFLERASFHLGVQVVLCGYLTLRFGP